MLSLLPFSFVLLILYKLKIYAASLSFFVAILTLIHLLQIRKQLAMSNNSFNPSRDSIALIIKGKT